MGFRLEDFRLKFIERKNQQLFGNNEIMESSIINNIIDNIINNIDNANKRKYYHFSY